MSTPHHIVILDGQPMNPGDLDLSPLEALGTVTTYPRTAPEEVLSRLSDATIVLTNKVPFDADRLAALPKLKYIGVTATGTNIIDLEAATKHGVTVTNVPGYSTPSVAQTVFALLLEMTNATALHSTAVHAGDWAQSPDFCFTRSPLTELSGRTFGLIGWGAIAQATARIAQAFDMNILATSRRNQSGSADGATFTTMADLLQRSDIVSLHCPLTPETEHLINSDTLATMRPGSYLINTARGPLLDEAAVAASLQAGHLAGCGVDVLSTEPPAADNPLIKAPNCVITPHIAWATQAARQRLLNVVVANLAAWQDGKATNVVQ